MIIDASVNFSKGEELHKLEAQASLSQREIYEDCKYDYKCKPPFLKGRFGGNINMIGGSAYSLSLNPRVRL